jgi:hypothetical protein
VRNRINPKKDETADDLHNPQALADQRLLGLAHDVLPGKRKRAFSKAIKNCLYLLGSGQHTGNER